MTGAPSTSARSTATRSTTAPSTTAPSTTAGAIALVEAASGPDDLFGVDAARAYRRLAQLTHPDTCPGDARAASAFAKLARLWRQHQDGHGVLVARGDIANLYRVSEGLLKVARDPADNDLMRAETIALAALRTRVEPPFQAYFPKPVRAQRRRDPSSGVEHRANVIGRAWSKTCWARRSRSGRTGRPRPTSARWPRRYTPAFPRPDGEDDQMRLIYVAYRAQPDDSPTGAFNSGSGATLIRESRRRISTLFGFLAVCCAVALARGVPGAQTTAGRVTAAAVFGGLLVLLIVGWIVMVRRPRHLEITEDAVRYVQRNGQVSALSRRDGDELRWVKQLRGRVWRRGLTIVGTDTVMLLGTFSRQAVRHACLARGWRFDDRASSHADAHRPALG